MTPEERARRLIDHCDNELHGYYPVATVALAISDALAEAAPKWTKEPPTVPGWYWLRNGGEFTKNPTLVRCRVACWDDQTRKGLEWLWPDGSGGVLVSKGGEWAGPLTPPEADDVVQG